MTEVDVALPEGVAEPTTKLASASNSPQPEPEPQRPSDSPQPVDKELEEEEKEQPEKLNADEQQLDGNKEKLEELDKKIDIPAADADKDDDVTDVTEALPKAPAPEELTEEDDDEEDLDGEDSQITSTSSKEPKLHDDDLDEEAEEEVTTNGDHEPDADAEDEDEAEKIGSTAENSCEAEDPLGAAATVEEVELLSKKTNLEEGESEEDALLDDEEEELDLSAKKANGFVKQKENGQASASEVSGVVNLDEDSDEEMEDLTAHKVPAKPIEKAAKPPTIINHNNSGNESSDDAVLIASDSEPETSAPPPQAPVPAKKLSPVVTAPAVVKATPPPPDDDDDDDDCVVIEDDTPPSISPSSGKRKSDMDELQLQPSHKRQRSSTPSGLGQLTIKDARSLMPHDGSTAVSGAGGGPRDSVYPVTITNAVTGAATNLGIVPPKLVPMSTMNSSPVQQLNPPTLSLTGLPSMTNNANLLPGLTDDMFVLEAPSFIVPYIYEKPPHENICEVVKAIETKYALSAEDLAEADKGDEFDMMTEQNKEDKPVEQGGEAGGGGGGKKKKKRGDDESWSEQSDDDDDDDDDDDSESGVRTKVLIKEANDDLTALKGAIKPAAALAATGGVTSTTAGSKPGQENYFESPLGKFFMDIGVGLVQEYVQADLLRLQKRKMRKAQVGSKEFEMAINALSGNLQASKTKNAPFKFRMKRCEFCNFKSESAMAMANHYETPHMNGVLYKCNFCTFEIRNATEIVYHMEAVHNIKARLIKPLPYHQCPNCGFEDNGKAKLARHQPVCAKKFRPELNLAPPNDWEAPAKIPRIKPRHGLVGTATAYQVSVLELNKSPKNL